MNKFTETWVCGFLFLTLFSLAGCGTARSITVIISPVSGEMEKVNSPNSSDASYRIGLVDNGQSVLSMELAYGRKEQDLRVKTVLTVRSENGQCFIIPSKTEVSRIDFDERRVKQASTEDLFLSYQFTTDKNFTVSLCETNGGSKDGFSSYVVITSVSFTVLAK